MCIRDSTIYRNFRHAIENDRTLINNGRYAEHIARYLQFFKSDQLKLFTYEDIKNNPVGTIQDVYKFLGLKNINFVPIAAEQRHNQTGGRRARIKNQFIWNQLLKARYYLQYAPKTENIIKNRGLFALVKRKFRIVDGTTKDTPSSVNPDAMKKNDRQYIINQLHDDISSLEKILACNLDAWKQI